MTSLSINGSLGAVELNRQTCVEAGSVLTIGKRPL